MAEKSRSTGGTSFSGRLGYVLAVAGSAVGLGNIWRFPYLAAKYGGGIFLLTYVILAMTFGFTLLITETALGRRTGKGPVGTYRRLGAKKLMAGGWLNAVIPGVIVPYYCVIGGWVCKYLFAYLSGSAPALAQSSYFSDYIAKPAEPAFWLCVFAGITFFVVLAGVEKGVERVSKIMMPALVLMAILIAGYSVSRPGALAGVKYYLVPEFSDFSLMTVVAAMGQMFYSLSIAMGILITYGSYMKKEIDMEKSIIQVEIMDSLVAFLAGLMIIPSVFVFLGGDPGTLQEGPSLMFITMPQVFGSMRLSGIVGSIFFLLVLFAALTSSISLMETCVATLGEKTGWPRSFCCVLTVLEILIFGVPCSLGFGLWQKIRPLGMSILDFFDFISNSVMMPLAAICTCGFVLKVAGLEVIKEEVKLSSEFRLEKAYNICIRYLAIPCLALILGSSILKAFGIITI